MRISFVTSLLPVLLLARAAVAGVQEDKDAIGDVARQVIPTKNSDQYIPAFQQLASVFGDAKSLDALRANPTSDEFQGGLRGLLADVNRAMWVYYDDKPTLDYLRKLASRIKSAM
ncbi:hypothetical protein H4R20_005492 [Coemansia guatemalensis]|uniref:Secreted RxLR effector peptide protein n=1 Tax=Coemansia guatemalensis TaxID=2761395 RepID=A0A9W8LRS9_9FUNG|nr:hypothetical protein H4R20_005492 [Coemansia guatemalensis]